MKHKIVKIIGHPDDSRYPLDYERLVLAAKENNVLLEVNNSSLSPNAFRENAKENYMIMLRLCAVHKVKVIINSDAHFHEYVGATNFAQALLDEISFPSKLVINNLDLSSFINLKSEFEKNRR